MNDIWESFAGVYRAFWGKTVCKWDGTDHQINKYLYVCTYVYELQLATIVVLLNFWEVNAWINKNTVQDKNYDISYLCVLTGIYAYAYTHTHIYIYIYMYIYM